MKPLSEMRILYLSDVNSSHTQKWAIALASEGFQVGIFSLSLPEYDWFTEKGIKLFTGIPLKKGSFNSTEIGKIKYLLSFKKLRKAISEFSPEIVHAHYATSYGLLGRLSRFHPFFISVWGSDVLKYPTKSFFHKWILKKNLLAAEQLFSTSKTLYDEVMKVVKKESLIIPFGIDTSVFKPVKRKNIFEEDALVIGTIKSLEKNYCIDILIKSFAILYHKYPSLRLRMLIVGGGREEINLKALAENLGIKDSVRFTGKIRHQDIVEYHNEIDIFANLSEYESFGVTVLEASACAKPVVVTDTGGLREVVSNNESGILVPVRNVNATVDAIEKLILDEPMRIKMGDRGRKRVIEKYEWKNSLQKMIQIYQQYE